MQHEWCRMANATLTEAAAMSLHLKASLLLPLKESPASLSSDPPRSVRWSPCWILECNLPRRVLTAAEYVLMNTTAKSNTWGERKVGVRWRGSVIVLHPPYLRYERGGGGRSKGSWEAMGGMKKWWRDRKSGTTWGWVGGSSCGAVPPQSPRTPRGDVDLYICSMCVSEWKTLKCRTEYTSLWYNTPAAQTLETHFRTSDTLNACYYKLSR